MSNAPHLEIKHEEESVWLVDGPTRQRIDTLRPQELALLLNLDRWNKEHNHLEEPCPFETLSLALWPDQDPDYGKAHIIRLVKDIRAKIERNPADPDILVNVRRKGYVLRSGPYFRADDYPPFSVGAPIRHPRFFFGRSSEVAEIFGLWKPGSMPTVAVVGPKWSGKSSLANFLQTFLATPASQLRPDQERFEWGGVPDRLRVVLVDFKQDPRMSDPGRLLKHILEGLGLEAPDPCDLHSFLDSIEFGLANPGVVIMDGIDNALGARDLDAQFWRSLRFSGTTGGHGRLGFVLTARASPSVLAKDAGKDSPFFNTIGFTFSLDRLDDQDALALINSSPVGFDDDEIAWILEKSERWPATLQLCCDLCLREHRGELDGRDWRDLASERLSAFSHLLAP